MLLGHAPCQVFGWPYCITCKLKGSETKQWILNGEGAGGAGASGSDSDEEDSEWEDDAPSSSEDESSSDSVGMPYVEAPRIGRLDAQTGVLECIV